MDKTKQTKRLISVRFKPSMRDKLDHIALTSDRTIAQLVRYALIAYFEVERVCVIDNTSNEKDSASRHTALRLPEDIALKVEALSSKCDVTFSDVIRDAVNVWLTQYNLEHLGSPSTSEGGDS